MLGTRVVMFWNAVSGLAEAEEISRAFLLCESQEETGCSRNIGDAALLAAQPLHSILLSGLSVGTLL